VSTLVGLGGILYRERSWRRKRGMLIVGKSGNGAATREWPTECREFDVGAQTRSF